MTQAATRRDRIAEATRRELLDAGYALFTTQSYAEITGEQICTRAGVTRGALQHHFGNKLGLFIAIFEGLQQDVVGAVLNAVEPVADPWAQAYAGIAAFLDACTTPAYQAVVLKEGPAAIGWQRWRQLDADYFSGIVDGLIASLASDGLADHPATMLAAMVRGTLTEFSFEIAQSDDHQRALQDALAVVRRLLDSFRLRESGPVRRIGMGQLRNSAAVYLDEVVAGSRLHIVRRGKVVAELSPTNSEAPT